MTGPAVSNSIAYVVGDLLFRNIWWQSRESCGSFQIRARVFASLKVGDSTSYRQLEQLVGGGDQVQVCQYDIP